ncbi:membrane protein [Pseudomonas lactis]|uniref:YkvI family membrane protein n=1 Tax=Pseudomonas lactis TaxID=1615674 RepID=UPI00054B743B|nr:membrane protein [Pseudomonas lactis]
MNKQSIQIALAYMSVVIGGGFASGQEVLQFFTGYGLIGIVGTLMSGVLFAFLGMQIARMSSQMQANSHKEVLYRLFGTRIGLVVDVVLSFFLYGVGVVMLAGSGSIFTQEYDLPPLFGGVLMTVLVIATLCLNVKRIINLISAVMPFLLAMVLIITTYSIFSYNAPIETLDAIARENNKTVTGNWFVGALLYASFNIAVGFPMLAVIGGMTKQPKAAALGGILGGLGLGALILMLNIGLFANINQLQGIEMPSLALAGRISPLLSVVMSIALVCMVYSTAVGMFFAFSARFAKPDSRRFKLVSAATVCVGLGLSLGGFSKLVGTVYPLLGYVGFALILAIGFSWLRGRSAAKTQKAELNAIS